jgi:hypothetical protein
MKYGIVSFLFVAILAGCNSSKKFKPEQFSNANLSEFSTGMEQQGNLTGDKAILELLWKPTLEEWKLEDALKGEYNSTYLYSWQGEIGDKQHFVVRLTSECDEALYYFVFDGDQYISSLLLASEQQCGDFYQASSARITGKEITIDYEGYGVTMIYPERTKQRCMIGEDGLIVCDAAWGRYPGVCMYDRIGLRERPFKDAKILTQVSLLEEFAFADSAFVKENSEYIFVELKDGKQGYLQRNLLALKAMAGVVSEEAAVYRRPDELTLTTDRFYGLDLVAVTGRDDNSFEPMWLKVRGRPAGQKNFVEGWIKIESFSMYPSDVAVAVYAQKAFAETDDAKRIQLLTDLVNNPDFQGSRMLEYVYERIQ